MTAPQAPVTLTAMPSLILQRKWHFSDADPKEINTLAQRSGVPPLIARLLIQRGFQEPDAVTRHLTPSLQFLNDPGLMQDMDRAVDRLVEAVAGREPVVVFGDYDADGITAAALLARFFEGLRLPICVHLPHREHEGYGLNSEAIRKLAYEGCHLLVTVDCGISNHEEIALSNELGMDVIVTDHHEPPPVLPPALAVVNPKRLDCPFPFKEMAGVGVAFNLVRALRRRLHSLGHWTSDELPNLKAYLDLVAIGTIADVVPMIGDNRVLTRVGLEVLDEERSPGIRALHSCCGLKHPCTAKDVAFRLAPRINAAGRMAHADTAWRLLTTNDEAEAVRLADTLDRLNLERKIEEARILKEASAQVKELGAQPGYVLTSHGWRRGVVGIVASRLIELLARPTILLALEGEEAHGSGRSPEGLNLYKALASCSEHLTAFGGHKAAAGLHLSATDIGAFTKAFHRALTAATAGRDLTPRVQVDGHASVTDLMNPVFQRLYAMLEPFGAGYPEPLLAISGSNVCRRRIVGERHLKLHLAANPQDLPALDLMAWGLAERIDMPWNALELACRPYINRWNGQQRLELHLEDARPEGAHDTIVGVDT